MSQFEYGLVCGAAATIALIAIGFIVFALADRLAQQQAAGVLPPLQPSTPWPRTAAGSLTLPPAHGEERRGQTPPLVSRPSRAGGGFNFPRADTGD